MVLIAKLLIVVCFAYALFSMLVVTYAIARTAADRRKKKLRRKADAARRRHNRL